MRDNGDGAMARCAQGEKGERTTPGEQEQREKQKRDRERMKKCVSVCCAGSN